MPAHVRKDDDVIILTGDYRGQTGKVVRVIPKSGRVIVRGPGIDGIVKNMRRSRVNPEGGRVELDRSFHISNVSPVVDGKPSRVRFTEKKDGAKVRVAARGGKELGQVRAPTKKKK